MPVKPVHRRPGALLNHHFYRFRRLLEGVLHQPALLPWKPAQHIVRQVHPGRLIAHAYLDARKLLGSQMGDNIFDPVMSPGAALGPDAQLPHVQAHVIIHHYNMIRIDFIEIRRRAHALPAEIHEGLGL